MKKKSGKMPGFMKKLEGSKADMKADKKMASKMKATNKKGMKY